MTLFGLLKGLFEKGKQAKPETISECTPADVQEKTQVSSEPNSAEAAAQNIAVISESELAVSETAEQPYTEVPAEEAFELLAAEVPEVSETQENFAVPETLVVPETPENSRVPEVLESPTVPEAVETFAPNISEGAAVTEETEKPINESGHIASDIPDGFEIDIDGPLEEGNFPMELLDDMQIPLEAYDYDDDALVYQPSPEPEAEEPAPAESFPEVVPQVFLNPNRKISDIIALLRRYADGTQILFCRDAAAAAQIRAALEERGFRSTLCTSDLPADTRNDAMEKAAAGTPSTLLVDDIADMIPVNPSCIIFCEMPADLADYQKKQAWAACDAVYVLYQTADFVVAMQKILTDGQNSERIYQLNRARAWLVTNGTDPRELNRKLAAETPVAQAAGSCAAMTFVVTGKVYRFPSRAALKNYITEHDGILGTSVTKDTNYLITNDTESGSAKNRKAAELGTKVISEDDFINLFCGGSVPGIKQA